jgi:hypothetical protein
MLSLGVVLPILLPIPRSGLAENSGRELTGSGSVPEGFLDRAQVKSLWAFSRIVPLPNPVQQAADEAALPPR